MDEYIKNQPLINIGCLGCVSDGKSTLIKCLTGIKTQRHSREKNENLSIKQGYANLKIYENEKLINHISFVDCPGHQDLILTLLTSLCLMDGVIIVIAVNNPINTKQQLKHQLLAVKLLKIKKIIVCLNKIDLIDIQITKERKKELDILFNEYGISPVIIIPTSFNKNIGIDTVLLYVKSIFTQYEYINKIDLIPLFSVNRSFDINKPGVSWENVKGGIIGGTLLQGKLKINDSLYISPGINNINNNGKNLNTPIESIQSDNLILQQIIPGGLIGLGTDIESFLCKNDNLKGSLCSTKELILYDEIKLKILDVAHPITIGTVNLLILSNVCECNIIKVNNNVLTCKLKNKIHVPDNYYIIIYNNTPINIIANAILFID